MKTISEVREEIIDYLCRKKIPPFYADIYAEEILSIVIGEEEKVIDGRGSITEVTIIKHPITIRDAIEEKIKK